jgi:ATP-dependent Lon protease
MKDYMANGRFSRGVDVIADASMAFVGNLDVSVEQVVSSTEYDLFHPLPPQFDLAVMDRFACYVPGWEMPKNSSEYLTSRYGFITDYLAEAFHYQLSHTNRYEEVNQRISLGTAVEGRDEKGIKKTVCAFLKILQPDGAPTEAEFDEYVAYAVEGRRRIKEQMNKRKPDDEFANIQLSYVRADGTEVIVYCPESQHAVATQQPVRKALDDQLQAKVLHEAQTIVPKEQPREEATPALVPPADQDAESGLQEQHFTILYGDTGYSYESILGPYLRGAKELRVEDPYIRLPHQLQNFVRFCETVVKALTVRKITLITSYEEKTQLADLQDKLGELQQSLLELDIVLDIQLNPNLHDREIRLDNGWVVKIGRGLDFYQRPQSWFEVGANDLSLRKCLETKVDIFKAETASTKRGDGRGAGSIRM